MQFTFGLLNGICWIRLLSAYACACADFARGGSGRSRVHQGFIFRMPTNLAPMSCSCGNSCSQPWQSHLRRPYLLSKLPPLLQHLISAGNEGPKRLLLCVDTPRSKLYVSPSMAVSMLKKFQCCTQTPHDFCPKGYLELHAHLSWEDRAGTR
jgi:hypothetical protein